MTIINPGDTTTQRNIVVTVNLSRPLRAGEKVRLFRGETQVGADIGAVDQEAVVFTDVITSLTGEDPLITYWARFVPTGGDPSDSPDFSFTFDDEIRCALQAMNPMPTPTITQVAVSSAEAGPPTVATVTSLPYTSDSVQLDGSGDSLWWRMQLSETVPSTSLNTALGVSGDTELGVFTQDGTDNGFSATASPGGGDMYVVFNAHEVLA